MMESMTDTKFSLDNLDALMRPGATIEKRAEGRHAGCWVTLTSGWVLSIQWGTGNYSDNYVKHGDEKPEDSTTAELAAWRADDPSKDMIRWGADEYSETVEGYVSMARVQHILDLLQEDKLVVMWQPPTPDPEPRAIDGWDEMPVATPLAESGPS